jgi:putative peptidoglycan lipid II flippase
MSLARNVFVQTFFTLGSKVLGFGRDLALNARFGGQGPFLDAWATAQMMPNFFRRLFAEGAFAQAFVPVYGKTRATEGDAAAADMASQVLAFMVLVVVAVSIVLEVAMPWLMPYLLHAYVDEPETLATATLMAQLAMPYLVCMTLASLFSGVLNTLGRFALSAGAPILLNICTLVPLLLVKDQHTAAVAAAGATALSGLLQAGLLGWGVRRMGVKLDIRWPAVTQVVQRVIVLAIPGVIAGGSMQLNTLVSQTLSGSDAGARGVLYNSDRLYQLPLSLIGVSVGLALVPRLAKQFATSDQAGASATMDDGVVLSMAFTLPGTVALLMMPFFIIDATVGHGHFTTDDGHRTAEVLRQFAWGVPAFVLAKVFTPPFFARQRTKQPMQFSIAAVLVNTILGASLWFFLPTIGLDGTIGLGVATSIGGWVNIALLSGTLAREGVYTVSARAWGRIARLAGASLIMGVFVGVCAWQYPLLSSLLWRKEVAVLVVVAAGFSLYAAAAFALRAITLAEIRGALRRERGAPAVDLPGASEG